VLRRMFLFLRVSLTAIITFAAPAFADNAHLEGNDPYRSPTTASR
jgi:hypothetical protein